MGRSEGERRNHLVRQDVVCLWHIHCVKCGAVLHCSQRNVDVAQWYYYDAEWLV